MNFNNKKFLGILLVFTVLLTLNFGFMPRIAKAISSSSACSYYFDYINKVTESGNKLIVLKMDEDLISFDTSLFSVDEGASIGSIDVDCSSNEIRIQIDGTDPAVHGYKLKIEAGGLIFNGYQQVSDIVIDFEGYEITPGFKSIFKDKSAANDLFESNSIDDIKLFVDSSYITNIKVKTLSDYNALVEFEISTKDEVDRISINVLGTVGDTIRELYLNENGVFNGVYQGIFDAKDVVIKAFDKAGKLLEKKVVRCSFGDSASTNFDTINLKDFDANGYTVRSLMDGAADKTLNELLEGKSYEDLDMIKVYYKNIDSVKVVNSENELALALSDLDNLSGQAVKIKLDSDIDLESDIVFDHDDTLIIDGNNHLLSGNILFGDGSGNNIIKLSNIVIDGTLTIDVGAYGEACLTNVILTDDNKILVESGGYSGIVLIDTQAAEMDVVNKSERTHIIACNGTEIQQTNIKGDYDVKITAENEGLFNSINLENDKKLYLVGAENATFKIVTIKEGINPSANIRLGKDTRVDLLNVNSPVIMTGLSTSMILVAKVNELLGDNAVIYDGFVIGNASGDKFIGTNIPENIVITEPVKVDNVGDLIEKINFKKIYGVSADLLMLTITVDCSVYDVVVNEKHLKYEGYNNYVDVNNYALGNKLSIKLYDSKKDLLGTMSVLVEY